MKTLSRLLFLAVFLSSISMAALANHTPETKHSSRMDEERKVSTFKGILISGAIKAVVKIGNEEKVLLEGDEDVIAEVITEVKDGILTIRPKSKLNDWRKKFDNTKITAHITAKRLTSLTMSGSGSLEVENPVVATELTTTLSGSGSITVPIDVTFLTATISGSGDIKATGKGSEASIMINGSGNFKGNSFTADVVSTKISGSGSIYVTANKKIKALAVGSGTVYYSGNPAIEKRVLGSGDVRKN